MKQSETGCKTRAVNKLLFVEVVERRIIEQRVTGRISRGDDIIEAVDDAVYYLLRVNESVNILQDTVSVQK